MANKNFTAIISLEFIFSEYKYYSKAIEDLKSVDIKKCPGDSDRILCKYINMPQGFIINKCIPAGINIEQMVQDKIKQYRYILSYYMDIAANCFGIQLLACCDDRVLFEKFDN